MQEQREHKTTQNQKDTPEINLPVNSDVQFITLFLKTPVSKRKHRPSPLTCTGEPGKFGVLMQVKFTSPQSPEPLTLLHKSTNGVGRLKLPVCHNRRGGFPNGYEMRRCVLELRGGRDMRNLNSQSLQGVVEPWHCKRQNNRGLGLPDPLGSVRCVFCSFDTGIFAFEERRHSASVQAELCYKYDKDSQSHDHS